MSDLATRLEAIEEALHAGVLTVSHNGRTVTYRSLADMRQIAADLRRQINGSGTRPRVTWARFSRGDG